MSAPTTTPSTTPSPPTTAIGYLRVSTAGQAETGMGLDVQRDKVTAYAEERGWTLTTVEEAASGGVRDGEIHSWEHRPVLLDLMGRAEAGEFTVLLVARLDRLSRDHPTLIVLERMLQRHGVEVISVAEENGDGPIAEFIRGQLALVAQLERAMILERVSAGKAKKKAMGRHVHGKVPYGYASEHGVMTPLPAEAEVIERVFREVKDGASPGKVAKRLNRDGIASPGGGAQGWTAKAIARIVENPAYVGERYGVKGAHPSIVTRRAFNVAGRALSARGEQYRRGDIAGCGV